MWIVDSSVWIDYFNGKVTPQTDLLHAALGQRPIGLGDIILAEVLQGFRRQEDFEAARDALLRFPVFVMGPSKARRTSATCAVAASPCVRRSIASSPRS